MSLTRLRVRAVGQTSATSISLTQAVTLKDQKEVADSDYSFLLLGA